MEGGCELDISWVKSAVVFSFYRQLHDAIYLHRFTPIILFSTCLFWICDNSLLLNGS